MRNFIAKTQCAKCARGRLGRSLPLGVILGICAMLPAADSWAAVSARFDRNSVRDGGFVTLIIESDGASSGEPNLSPLRKDFEVLGTSTSTQVSFVNGRRSELKRWVVRLQPRRPGTISVPPIAVGNEQTAALELTATETRSQAAAQGGKHAFLEVEGGAAGKPIYVQQQVPYTIRLFYDDTVEDGELAAPKMEDAIVEQLGDERRYTAVRDGKGYNVIERHYAVAPEKSGTLRIPATTFHGRAAVASTNAGSDNDADNMLAQFLRDSPFANDPVFKNGLLPNIRFAVEGQPVAASSRELTLDVRPRPAAATASWLPAEQVTLHDSWADNPPRLKVGEPVTRTITVDVKGLAASQIPTIQVARPEHTRLYPETADNESRTDGNAVYGTSKQSVTYIPTAEGALTVPSIDLDWWNTHTDSASRATLPSLNLSVLPGAAGVGSLPLPTAAPRATAPATATEAATLSWWQALRSRVDGAKAYATWLAVGIAALLAAVALFVFGRRSRVQLPAAAAKRSAREMSPEPALKAALRALRYACAANDAHAAARALLRVGRARWPRNPPEGLRALADNVETGGEAISNLERSLYAANAPAWTGAALWDAFRRGPQETRNNPPRAADGLEPLYR